MPGTAALEALAQAQRLRPDLQQQALIDYLVVNGAWLLQFGPPRLLGLNRDRWRLPPGMRADEVPGNFAGAPQGRVSRRPGAIDCQAPGAQDDQP